MADSWDVAKSWPELILETSEEDGVARITLNRPEKRNALNEALVDAFFESLEIIRANPALKCVITRGAGINYSSGLDLTFLRAMNEQGLRDWDRPTPTIQLAEAVRAFPRIMIAQVHGYCLGGALGIVNCHDMIFAAEDAQFGMPEILRGSFGQLVTSTLLHSGIPIKKLTYIQLVGRNLSGVEADAIGMISRCVPIDDLEETTIGIAKEIGSRHLAPLEHSKIAVQMGRDLTMSQAIQLDQLVGSRLRHEMNPLDNVEDYLKSQKGGPNVTYKRPDV